jgi:hypothetical protein
MNCKAPGWRRLCHELLLPQQHRRTDQSPRWATYVECNIVARLSNHYCHGNATVVDVHVSPLTRNVESLATEMQQRVVLIVALHVAMNMTHFGRHVKCPIFLSDFNQI